MRSADHRTAARFGDAVNRELQPGDGEQQKSRVWLSEKRVRSAVTGPCGFSSCRSILCRYFDIDVHPFEALCHEDPPLTGGLKFEAGRSS
jgi:hypothetical protein